jgi:hypothetical protein
VLSQKAVQRYEEKMKKRKKEHINMKKTGFFLQETGKMSIFAVELTDERTKTNINTHVNDKPANHTQQDCSVNLRVLSKR